MLQTGRFGTKLSLSVERAKSTFVFKNLGFVAFDTCSPFHLSKVSHQLLQFFPFSLDIWYVKFTPIQEVVTSVYSHESPPLV